MVCRILTNLFSKIFWKTYIAFMWMWKQTHVNSVTLLVFEMHVIFLR